MRKGFYIMQALVAGAIVLNVVLSDFIKTGVPTARDIPSAIVIVVMLYLLWSNWRSQKNREQMIADATRKYQAMMDEFAQEDAAREARWAEQEAEILDLTREHQVEDI